MLERVPCNLKTMKKEDMRALEGDLEKDEDCQADSEETRSNDPGYSSVDFEGNLLFFSIFQSAINTAFRIAQIDSSIIREKF